MNEFAAEGIHNSLVTYSYSLASFLSLVLESVNKCMYICAHGHMYVQKYFNWILSVQVLYMLTFLPKLSQKLKIFKHF